jgi:predicted O-methyltransferase YrrM
MGLKHFLQKITPAFIRTRYIISKDLRELNSIQRIDCDLSNLRKKSNLSMENLFQSGEIEKQWSNSKKEIDAFRIPDGSGGVNPGDRRAIYYLISYLKPSTVLEIGTHIGASTVHIASPLSLNRKNNGESANLTTVDIMDVNSQTTKPWLKYGTKYSPIDMISKLNYESFVKFVTDTSLHYAANSNQKFDFIFLDGSHAASVVYQEIPMALKLLKPNGVILLHDYFPEMKPLWPDGALLPGPFLATERLKKEGVNLIVLPLGKLPWPTKLGTNITSLALLLNNE